MPLGHRPLSSAPLAGYLSAAGSASTGTLSATLDAVTSVATGSLSITGSASPTLAALTSSATGSLSITGVLSQTLAAATLSATATLTINGALATTLGTLTLAATGTLGSASVGSLNVTLDALTAVITSTGGSTGDGLDPSNSRAVSGSQGIITRYYCQLCDERVDITTIKKRWDGVWCCPNCWEPRHPMDFYRPRAEKLNVGKPPLFPNANETTFTPTCSAGISASAVKEGTYAVDGAGYTQVRVVLTPATNNTVAMSGSSTIDTPTSVSVAGSGTITDSKTGQLLSLCTVSLAGKITNLTAISATSNTLLVRVRYTH